MSRYPNGEFSELRGSAKQSRVACERHEGVLNRCVAVAAREDESNESK
jgi:hypothetical protein